MFHFIACNFFIRSGIKFNNGEFSKRMGRYLNTGMFKIEGTDMFTKKPRELCAVVLAASLSYLAATPALAADPVHVSADLIFMRPAGVAAMAIGTGTFIASLPVTYITGTHRKAAEELVVKPYEFTVKRPLGQ